MNTPDKKLDMILDEKDISSIINPYFSEMKYAWHIFGTINENSNPLSNQHTLERLSKIKTIGELIEIIIFIVVNNWFLVKDKKPCPAV